MRMLERSPELEEVTHLVLDEVHERSIDSDFLMIVLKKLLLRRKDLKYVGCFSPMAFVFLPSTGLSLCLPLSMRTNFQNILTAPLY